MEPKTFLAGGRILPISLLHIFDEPPQEYYDAPHFDPAANFHYDLVKITSGPGQSRPDQGYTARSMQVVPSHSLLMLSAAGIFLDEKKYPGIKSFMVSLGFFIYGSSVYPKHSGSMMINTIGAISAIEVSVPNVQLKAIKGKRLKEIYPHLTDVCIDKRTYIVVINIVDVENSDLLLCRNYGTQSRIPFGTTNFINSEKNCYRLYDNAILAPPIRKRVCYRCFLTLNSDFETYLEELEYLTSHKLACIPRMNGFVLPQLFAKTLAELERENTL